jgi:hypothetical protein
MKKWKMFEGGDETTEELEEFVTTVASTNDTDEYVFVDASEDELPEEVSAVSPLLVEPVDNIGQTCTECGKGVYRPGSIRDNELGVLHCTKCNHMVPRFP